MRRVLRKKGKVSRGNIEKLQRNLPSVAKGLVQDLVDVQSGSSWFPEGKNAEVNRKLGKNERKSTFSRFTMGPEIQRGEELLKSHWF